MRISDWSSDVCSSDLPAVHAHLLEFDTVHGRWRRPISHDADSVTIDGRRVRLTTEHRIEDMPLATLGVDVVVDCTGVFKTPAKLQPYYAAGVAKVVVSADRKSTRLNSSH